MSTLSHEARDRAIDQVATEVESIPDFGAPATTFDGERHHDVPAPVMPDAPEPAEEVVDGEVVPELAVVPYSGEALELADMTFDQLAAVLDAARQFEQVDMRTFKGQVQEEVLRRMDANALEGVTGAWTVHVDDWTIQGDSPNKTEYPVDAVKRVLKALVDEGKIGQPAMDTIIVPERYKVAKRALEQLLKLGGEVAERIKAVEQPVTRRYVNLKREA